jgi:hypothetical protein
MTEHQCLRPLIEGIQISNADDQSINITPCKLHGDWNYIIKPREKR